MGAPAIAAVYRRRERCRGWLVVAACTVWLSPVPGQQLLERIVARVNGEVISLTDLKAAVALGVVEAPAGADETVAIERLIDRQLVLAEVARFAPPEPAPADVDRETATLTMRVGSNLAGLMASTGIDEPRIRAIARDNLRIEAYLTQRFGATAQLTEEEVAQYYRIRPDEFTRDGTLTPFTQSEPLARARAGAERRASIVAQWMRDVRSRAEITFPTPPPATPPAR